MKKILLLSAFALFGSFAMANDIVTTTTEATVGGSLLVITVVKDCNGKEIGRSQKTMDCSSCEGANIKIVNTTYCPDAPQKPVDTVEEGEG